MLFFTASDFTLPRHIHSWASFPLWPSHSSLFGTISNCLLYIGKCSSSVAFDTFWPGRFIFWCHIFLPFILFMGFSWQEYWCGLPLSPPGDHALSELLTMTHPLWVALNRTAHSFFELHKPLCHDEVVIYEEDINIQENFNRFNLNRFNTFDLKGKIIRSSAVLKDILCAFPLKNEPIGLETCMLRTGYMGLCVLTVKFFHVSSIELTWYRS